MSYFRSMIEATGPATVGSGNTMKKKVRIYVLRRGMKEFYCLLACFLSLYVKYGKQDIEICLLLVCVCLFGWLKMGEKAADLKKDVNALPLPKGNQ